MCEEEMNRFVIYSIFGVFLLMFRVVMHDSTTTTIMAATPLNFTNAQVLASPASTGDIVAQLTNVTGTATITHGGTYVVLNNNTITLRAAGATRINTGNPIPIIGVTDGSGLTRYLVTKRFDMTDNVYAKPSGGNGTLVGVATQFQIRNQDATNSNHVAGYYKTAFEGLHLAPTDDVLYASFNLYVKNMPLSESGGVQLFQLADTSWTSTSMTTNTRPYMAADPMVGNVLASGLVAYHGTKNITTVDGERVEFDISNVSALDGELAFVLLGAETDTAATDNHYVYSKHANNALNVWPHVLVSYSTASPIYLEATQISVSEAGDTLDTPVALCDPNLLPSGTTSTQLTEVNGQLLTTYDPSTHQTFTREAGYYQVPGTHGTFYATIDGIVYYQANTANVGTTVSDEFLYRITTTIDGAQFTSNQASFVVAVQAANQPPSIALQTRHVISQPNGYAILHGETYAMQALDDSAQNVIATFTTADADGDDVEVQWSNGASPQTSGNQPIYAIDQANQRITLTSAGIQWIVDGNDAPPLTLVAVDDSGEANNYRLLKRHVVVSHARSVYVSQDGSGTKDGTTPVNALDVQTAFQKTSGNKTQYLQPGDTVFLIGVFTNPTYRATYEFLGSAPADVIDDALWKNEVTINMNSLVGTYDQPITVTALNQDTLIKGDGSAIIEVKGSRFIQLVNLHVQGQVQDPNRPSEGIDLDSARRLQMLYRVNKPDTTTNKNRFGDVLHYNDSAAGYSYYFRVYTDIAVNLGLYKPARATTWTFDDLYHHAELYSATDSSTHMFDITAATNAAGASVSRPSIIDTKGINVHSSYGINVIGNTVHHIPGTGIQSYYGAYLWFADNEVHDASRLSYTGTHGMQFYYVGEDVNQDFPTPDPFAADVQTPFNISSTKDYKIMVTGNTVHHNYNGQFSWNTTKLFIHPALDEGKGISPQYADPKTGQSNAWTADVDRFLIANNIAYRNGLAGIHNHEASRVDMVHNTVYMNHVYQSVFRVPYVSQQIGLTHQGGTDVDIQYNIAVVNDRTPAGTAVAAGPMNISDPGTFTMRATGNVLWSLDGSVLVDAYLSDTSVNLQSSPTAFVVSPQLLAPERGEFGLTAQSPRISDGSSWTTSTLVKEDAFGVIRNAVRSIGALEYVTFQYSSPNSATPTRTATVALSPTATVDTVATQTVVAGKTGTAITGATQTREVAQTATRVHQETAQAGVDQTRVAQTATMGAGRTQTVTAQTAIAATTHAFGATATAAREQTATAAIIVKSATAQALATAKAAVAQTQVALAQTAAAGKQQTANALATTKAGAVQTKAAIAQTAAAGKAQTATAGAVSKAQTAAPQLTAKAGAAQTKAAIAQTAAAAKAQTATAGAVSKAQTAAPQLTAKAGAAQTKVAIAQTAAAAKAQTATAGAISKAQTAAPQLTAKAAAAQTKVAAAQTALAARIRTKEALTTAKAGAKQTVISAKQTAFLVNQTSRVMTATSRAQRDVSINIWENATMTPNPRWRQATMTAQLRKQPTLSDGVPAYIQWQSRCAVCTDDAP